MKPIQTLAALLLALPLSAVAQTPVYTADTIFKAVGDVQAGAIEAREQAEGISSQMRSFEPLVAREPGHMWLEMGFGGGFGERKMELASGGYSLRYVQGVHAITIQRTRHLDMGRTGNNIFSCLFSLNCADVDLTTVSETALLYGRASASGNGYSIYSAGPVRTIMRNFDYLGDNRDSYGLRLEMAHQRTFGGLFALTSSLYVNINGENSFMGAVGSIGIGAFD